jgi:hypothetical protein
MGAVAAAVAGHALALVALSLPGQLRLGETRIEPMYTRMIEAPLMTTPGLATQSAPPAPAPRAQPQAPAPAKREAPSKRTPPRPQPAGEQEQAAPAQPMAAASEPDAQATAVASALPDGQDPLLMLPGTPERLHLLDQVSLAVAADPEAYTVGNAISVELQPPHEARTWRFVIDGEDFVVSPGGKHVRVLRLVHFPEHNKDDRLTVYIVPELAYRPVQIDVMPVGQPMARYTARNSLRLLDTDNTVAPARSTD